MAGPEVVAATGSEMVVATVSVTWVKESEVVSVSVERDTQADSTSKRNGKVFMWKGWGDES